ncbi:hypothetical protein DPMN_000438 [Dreissena polymorpha]|uniref:Uncharacterized protein n=1 Tax=Dreissena polymorpha TaxID=45954 RepID=A0A9D4MI06_DREPO|nr:hypothetical protein DPMN_000438 [Dreissena polymorpha]
MFERFGHLEALRFVGVQIVTLYPGSFRGLVNLRVLDLSNCVSLGYSNLRSAFESDTTLPSLQELILHMTGNREDNFIIRDAFAKLLYSRPVRVLDLSDITIKEYDLCQFSISVVDLANSNDNMDCKMPSLKILDVSRRDADKNRISHLWCVNEETGISNTVEAENYANVSMDAVYLDNMCGNTRVRKIVASSLVEVSCS